MDFETFRQKIALKIFEQKKDELVVLEENETIKVGFKHEDQESYHVLNLVNFYNSFSKGETLDNIVARILSIFDIKEQIKEDFDFTRVKHRILPQIKHVSFFKGENVQKAQLIYDSRFVVAGVTYVIDSQQSMVFVTQNHLDEWDITKEELHELAMKNLKKLPPIEKMTDPIPVYISSYGDSYDAARLLCLDLEKVKREFGTDVLIGIPNRDNLVVFPKIDPIIPVFAIKTINLFKAGPYEITPYLLLYENGKFVPIMVQPKT